MTSNEQLLREARAARGMPLAGAKRHAIGETDLPAFETRLHEGIRSLINGFLPRYCVLCGEVVSYQGQPAEEWAKTNRCSDHKETRFVSSPGSYRFCQYCSKRTTFKDFLKNGGKENGWPRSTGCASCSESVNALTHYCGRAFELIRNGVRAAIRGDKTNGPRFGKNPSKSQVDLVRKLGLTPPPTAVSCRRLISYIRDGNGGLGSTESERVALAMKSWVDWTGKRVRHNNKTGVVLYVIANSRRDLSIVIREHPRLAGKLPPFAAIVQYDHIPQRIKTSLRGLELEVINEEV